ncbi:TPA: toprim domain-containing protein [Streptococcus suis]|nr:toprim domain-containing protein [Streptococcus suis]
MALTKAQAKSLAILDIARSLGMEMKRISHKEYYWSEHDSFKIDTVKNTWHWYSRAGKYGDTIGLVQEIKGVSYSDALHYLEKGTFPEAKIVEEVREPFRYTLAPYERPFKEARTYLREERGLSDDTIDFFLEKGVLAQARRKDRDGFIEDVLVFKYLDQNKNIVGASLQGLTSYPDRHEGKGYLKQIMYQSEGIAGLNVSIGSPKRLIVTEAPIDLMSYYELHKDELEDVRLMAMEGLKEGTISRYAMETLQEQGVLIEDGHKDYTKASDLTQTSQFLANAAERSTLFHDHSQDNLITLAVDNDKAGTDFITRLKDKKIPIVDARPPKREHQDKMDWNDYMKQSKQGNVDGRFEEEGFLIEQGTKKAPDRSQKLSSNAGDLHRNPDSLGEDSPRSASKPVVDKPQPDFPVIAQLQFSTKGEYLSTIKPGYHVITDGELRRLNKFAPGLQATAQWYLKELAGSTITYLYQERDEIGKLDVKFSDENFAHLAGISPKGIDMRQVVHDFANGYGDYGNIQVSHAIKDKSMVLPLLPDILSTQAFVFNDLSSVEKLHKINLDQAIKTEDEDLLLAIRDLDGIGVPASVMRIKEKLSLDLSGKEKVVLGVYRERNGVVEKLSINEEYVKDGGKQFEDILKNGQFERYQEDVYNDEIQKQSIIDSDADGIPDEEERKHGTNPYDFRSKPETPSTDSSEVDSEVTVVTTSTVTIANFIQEKDIAGLNRHLKEGIKEYLDSKKYKDYLTKMSQLNNYSSRNLRFILAQNPEATQVASFKQWKETFGRHVNKGEKSLRIFAPMTKLKKDENNQPILDKYGKPEFTTFFGLVPVFDISQTSGKEMPKAISDVKEQLTDLDYANLYRSLMIIAKNNNVSVRFEEMVGETKGYYNPMENQIVLRSNDMNKSQLIKTFLHETAHSELHHAKNPQKEQLTRSTAELQAESVAYVVSAYYGLDTSDYSFGYLASWSDDKETLADLEAQLDIVQQEAKHLMVRMDQQLEQLRLSQEKQTKFQFEQKLQKFKDQSKQSVEEHKQELKQEAQSKKEKGFSK